MTTITSSDVAEAVAELSACSTLTEAEIWSEVGQCCTGCQAQAIGGIAGQFGLTSAPDAGQAAIVPASDGTYVELAGGSAPRFRKHLLTLGPLIHPKTGETLQLGEDFWQQIKRNFDAGVVPRPAVPLADAKNRHTEDPLANTGQIVGLERQGSKVYSVIEVRRPEVADGIRNGTLLGASAFLNLDYTDTRTGQKVGPALLHHCITNRPYVVDLEPYQEIAASASPGSQVLMLTAPGAPAATPIRGYPKMPQTLEITWDGLDERLRRFADLTGYAGETTGLTSTDTDVARYLAMCGQPARVADLRPASPVTEIRNAVEELAAQRGYDRGAFGLSRALDDLIEMKAATLPLDLGDELRMAMSGGDDLALAGAYALPDFGDKPKLPCDSPELVRSSWAALHRHYKCRLSAEDFADARSALLDAADGFGFSLNDSTGSPDPGGTPAVAATYGQMPLSAAADEVDRYLAMTGQSVAARSVGNPADLRLAGAAGSAYGSSYAPDWTSQADVNEAGRIAQRQASTGFFSKAASRVKGQSVTRDFSDEDDPAATANPSLGGQVHPEVARLMREHNNALGQAFGGEAPQTGSRKITPKVSSRNRVNPASGSSVLAAMSAPSASPHGSFSSPYLGL
jgi:hypothetical protein